MPSNMTGLTDKEVTTYRNKYGTNEISKKESNSFLNMFLETLGDPIIKILLIALGIKLVFLIQDFDWYETVGIVIAIFLASFISTASEYGSEKAFIKLQEESSKIKCKVLRNKKPEVINIDEIVCNDIVLLEAGDKIPADGILIKGDITVDESSLNGESKEAYKESVSGNVIDINKVYRGTVVCSKEAVMQVTKVGDATFYGRLAKEIQESEPISPLKLRLRELAKVISRIGYIGAFLVTFAYLFNVVVISNDFDGTKIVEMITNYPLISKHLLHSLTLSVTIIVVSVPEGLPMMITLVLSSNMKRMLKDNVLVRKLVGIETAGNINILFTDKTGTLTKGKLEVVGFTNGNLKEYKTETELYKDRKLYDIVSMSIVNNVASNYNEKKTYAFGGNITDRCLLEFIKKDYNLFQKNKAIPFDSKNKYSIVSITNGKKINLIKGAFEKLLPYCVYFYNELGEKKILTKKNNITNYIEELTLRGIRILLLATSEEAVCTNFRNLVLVGFILIKDEIRKEASTGIELVKEAHIQTVMVTGDNKNTAVGIAKEVGLITDDNDLVLTSDEISNMRDEELMKIMPKIKVIARSLPQDKSRLVKVAQKMNLVVGMTGDGVNDAPALKKSDVGFAMGSGTEVSKEASDIVILDDNFLSISKAIMYGRTIFKSIRKFIIFQITVNLCAVSLSIIGPFIGINTPVTVIQMLWINMVMDTLAGLAFAFEPPLVEYMREHPKKKDEPIINKYMWNEIMFTGFYSAILCILFLKIPTIINKFRIGSNNEYLMTAFFALFIFAGIFNSFNARTHRLNLLANIRKNKVFVIVISFVLLVQIVLIYKGGDLFRTTGLTMKELLVVVCLAATVIPIDGIRRSVLRMKGIKGGV